VLDETISTQGKNDLTPPPPCGCLERGSPWFLAAEETDQRAGTTVFDLSKQRTSQHVTMHEDAMGREESIHLEDLGNGVL
jgi:hypothetical protein